MVAVGNTGTCKVPILGPSLILKVATDGVDDAYKTCPPVKVCVLVVSGAAATSESAVNAARARHLL